MREQALVFSLDGSRLLGIATCPAVPTEVGVLMLVGGRQYRVGAHRQFTLLARRLASAGFSSFRFDYRGMGDSEGERRDFESVAADIAAALQAFLQACPGVRRVVIWGLCDAATAAVLFWHGARDPRVAGLCLANPWLHSEAGEARARVRHYYLQRLLAPDFWRKLRRGEVAPWRSLREFGQQWRQARRASPADDFRALTLAGLRAFPGPLLVLLSGQDLTARLFLDTVTDHAGDFFGKANVRRFDVPEADHTFSCRAWRETAELAVESWLLEFFRPAPTALAPEKDV